MAKARLGCGLEPPGARHRRGASGLIERAAGRLEVYEHDPGAVREYGPRVSPSTHFPWMGAPLG